MGGGRWDPTDWDGYKTTRGYDSKSTAAIFTSSSLNKDLNPHGVKLRESRDSKDNPVSNAIILSIDVTGSMGMIADTMIRTGLNTLCTQIYDRKPVSDPHIMCMGIGDVEYDQAPLQITQFEADIRIAAQLEKIWLEHGGGGNSHESYHLPWYFGAMHTGIDCFEKRGKKGYLFTVGDEQPPIELLSNEIEKIMGTKPQQDYTTQQLLTMVSRMYEVYHIMVEEGSHFIGHGKKVVEEWTALLGQRAIKLSDHTKLAEVIVSAIQVNEGTDVATVSKSWDGKTSLVVSKAIKDLKKGSKGTSAVVRF